LSVKEAPQYLGLISCQSRVTQFVTSSNYTVLQALLREKLSVYDQIVIKNLKSRKYG